MLAYVLSITMIAMLVLAIAFAAMTSRRTRKAWRELVVQDRELKARLDRAIKVAKANLKKLMEES